MQQYEGIIYIGMEDLNPWGILAEILLEPYSPNQTWFYERLLFKVVIVMVKDNVNVNQNQFCGLHEVDYSNVTSSNVMLMVMLLKTSCDYSRQRMRNSPKMTEGTEKIVRQSESSRQRVFEIVDVDCRSLTNCL